MARHRVSIRQISGPSLHHQPHVHMYNDNQKSLTVVLYDGRECQLCQLPSTQTPPECHTEESGACRHFLNSSREVPPYSPPFSRTNALPLNSVCISSHHHLTMSGEAPPSPILRILSALSPPQSPPEGVPYDGLEYRWRMLVIRPALFKTEGILLAVLGTYLLWYYVGGYVSYGRAPEDVGLQQIVLPSLHADMMCCQHVIV